MAHAIPDPQSQFLQICSAASWLCPPDRDQFWAAVAADLAGREIGEGVITRAVYAAFQVVHYKPHSRCPTSRSCCASLPTALTSWRRNTTPSKPTAKRRRRSDTR